MYRFWETIVKPVLKIVNPKDIVEIGAEFGLNTEKLLGYCRENNAMLYSIDPAPAFDVNKCKEENRSHVRFFKSLSLDAIGLIDKFDLFLIDGDHNWYTVFNELKLIEKQCKKNNSKFPLVFFHDIGWPYARRDLYYNPDNIPKAFLKPYQQKGMVIGTSELVEKGGVNPGMNNAIYENGLQSGVLTAIEDFIDETQHKVRFINIPGLHGFGIILPLHFESLYPKLTTFLDQYSSDTAVIKHVENIEKERIENLIHISNALYEVDVLRDLKEQETKAKQVMEKQVGDLDIKIQKLHAREKILIDQVNTLSTWIESIEQGVTALIKSRRWRIAVLVGEFIRKIRFRSKIPMVEDYLAVTLKDFNGWKDRLNNKGNIKPTTPAIDDYTIKKKVYNIFQSPLPFKLPSVDIVILVHNSLENVKNCLESIVRNTPYRFHLIIINNGSNEKTVKFLNDFIRLNPNSNLINNSEQKNHASTVNQGLKISKSDYVVMLAHNIIVPVFWLERILECGESDANIGILGPLSNCTDSLQSITNLPNIGSVSAEEIANVVAITSEKDFPKVPFINRFCFVIKREVINKIGYFDEQAFPKGYGGENDFCLRARLSGFDLALADHGYVHHAKLNNDKPQRLQTITIEGEDILKKRYPEIDISGLLKHFENDPVLTKIREQVGKYSNNSDGIRKLLSKSLLKILFVLPVTADGKENRAVVHEAFDMRCMGFNVQIAIKKIHESDYYRNYSSLVDQDENLFFIFDKDKELILHGEKFNVVISCIHESVKLTRKIVEFNASVLSMDLTQNSSIKASGYSASMSAIEKISTLTEQWNRYFQIKHVRHRKPKIHSLLIGTDIKKTIASYYLRHYLPFTHSLFQDKYDFSTITLDKVLKTDADVLVIQRVALPDETFALRLLEHCQKKGIQTIYETDDHLFGLPPNMMQHYRVALPAVKIFAEHANMVVTSSEKLKSQFLKYNGNVQVIPNALDERLWKPVGRKAHSKLRILYMGTYTHLNDLLVVEDAMKRILDKFNGDVIFDVIGITEEQNNLEWINPITIPNHNYPKFVKWLCENARWSIGIAPLEPTQFNNCKSYIKYLDYTALGLVPVCSNLPPYQDVIKTGHNGLLVDNNTNSWYEALNSLIENEEYRDKLAKSAYQDLIKNHTLKAMINNWIDAFKEVITTEQA